MRNSIGFAILAAAAAAVPTAALACRCLPGTPRTFYRNAQSVVLAQVGAREERDGQSTYRLKVRSAWKRRQPKTLLIAAELNDCTVELTAGRTYLLYLSFGPDGVARTSLCSGDLPAKEAVARIRLLGRPLT